ncbi:MAG: response regulator [Proteobacteria bacterium]|nr:response regulator [Pseudomonadota bacterium]
MNRILGKLEDIIRVIVRNSGARRDRLAFVTLVVVTQGLLMAALLSMAQWWLLRDAPVPAALVIVAGSLALTGLGHLLLRRTLFEKLLSLKAGLQEAERSRSRAEEAAQEKTQLLATMTHEIRTPLNGVIGMLGILLETELTPEQRNYSTMAHGSGRTLLSFIDEILDGAKSEALDTGEARDIELAALIENVTELLSPRAQAKGIDIACRVDPALPHYIHGSGTQLRQLLFNLAGNAIKFTQSGGVHIEALRGSDDALVIRVSDTGIGMSDGERARIFDAYAQANGDTARRFGGTGLGLFISREIVLGLGGSLEVESEPGKGTVFIACLPGLAAGEAAEDVARPLAGRSYVLLLSDSFIARHVRQALEDLGARVAISSARDEALLADAGSNLICDPAAAQALLPLAQRLAPNAPLPQIWVLLTPEERRPLRDLLQKPVTGYLLRPIRRSTLTERLARADTAALKNTERRMRDKAAPPPAARKLRVLLADDTPVNAFVARTMLERRGHKVVVVESGAAALAELRAGHRFDILLLDMEMPGLSGPETSQAIRQRETERGDGARVPILALTANTRPEAIAACITSGMDDHLAKPYDLQDLEEALNRLTARKAA